MAIPILVIGKSGSGKSASMRNFPSDKLGVINVMGKPLPFRNQLKTLRTTSYDDIAKILSEAKAKSLVVDDAGYLITNQFMAGHSSTGKGNAVFSLYNDLADRFYSLIRFVVNQLPEDKIVYLTMHEDKNDFGDVRPKTIGKLLDEKVCVEGLFTIVLRSVYENGKYIFKTQTSGFDVAKSPIGLFDSVDIDNDLYAVDNAVRSYYNIEIKEDTNEKTK